MISRRRRVFRCEIEWSPGSSTSEEPASGFIFGQLCVKRGRFIVPFEFLVGACQPELGIVGQAAFGELFERLFEEVPRRLGILQTKSGIGQVRQCPFHEFVLWILIQKAVEFVRR